jgi:hypothetical protein
MLLTTSVQRPFIFEWRMADVSLRIEPIGTGLAKEIPSKDKNPGERLMNREALAKPSS